MVGLNATLHSGDDAMACFAYQELWGSCGISTNRLVRISAICSPNHRKLPLRAHVQSRLGPLEVRDNLDVLRHMQQRLSGHV